MARRFSTKKQQVNMRLYAVDVQELKRRGAATDTPWQTLARKLLHKALSKETKLV